MNNPYDRDILRLALPSIVSNITVPLLGLVDVTVMGHIGDARYIAAIAVGSMIFNVVYWLFGFLRMGTSGLTAQAYGARKADEASNVLLRSLTLAFGIACTILILQVPLRHLAIALMRPTADVLPFVIPYYNICIWGAPAMLGLYALTGWFIGMQNTRIPMVIAIGQNIVNIVVSLFLVFGLGMQVEGVALGTVVAQWCGLLMALLFVGRFPEAHGLRLSRAIFQKMGHFLRINRDIFLRTLFLVAVNLFFTSAGAAQGAVVLAVNTLLMQLFTLFSYILDGFAYAGEALSGRYFGAGDEAGLQGVVRRLFGWGALMVVLFTLAYALGGQTFLALLTTDQTVVSAASEYVWWTLLIPVTGVAAFIWDGVFIGLTLSRGMFISSMVAAVVFFLLYFLLQPVWGNHALWLAFVVYLLMRGVVQTWLYATTARLRP